MLTAVSLFAGVGGIDLALHRAGFQVTSAVEINPAAHGVLADRFSDTHLHHDVTEVTADELLADGFDPDRGLVAAGFPCQDLSVAGGRRGMGEGTRSGLYWHVVRLLAQLRPRWVLLENVPGILSATCPCPGTGACGDPGCAVRGDLHPVPGGACPGGCIPTHGGVMGAVLGSLAELGYGFAYRVLDAQHFGVPQRRRRVVVVGCLGDDRRPVEVLLEPEGGVRDPAPGDQARPDVAGSTPSGSGSSSSARVIDGPVSTLQGGGRRGHRVDAEAAAGGHLVTYQKVVRSGARDENGDLPPEVWAHRDVAATLNLGDGGSSRQSLIAVTALDMRNAARESGAGVGTQGLGIREGGPSYALTSTERATPAVAFHLTQDPISGEQVPALGRKSGGQGVATETTVRRLTPRECERLQGYPDDWTLTSNGRHQADSPRYQQMGNSVAVPVFEWVARRIVAAS